MFKLLSNLKVFWKLALIVGLMAIPAVVTLYSYISEKTTSIQFSQKELYGTEYLRPLHKVYFNVLLHKNLAVDPARRGELPALQQTINAGLGDVGNVDARYGGGKDGSLNNQQLGSTPIFNDVKSLWTAAQSLNGTSAEIADRHEKLITRLGDLITKVADNSNLTLDPDLDTYYLMDATTIKLPDAAVALSQLYGQSTAVAQTKQITPETKFGISAQKTRLETDISGMLAGIGTGGKGWVSNKDDEKDIAPKATQFQNTVLALTAQTDQKVIKAEKIEVDPNAYFSEGQKAQREMASFYETALTKLTSLLQKRVDTYSGQRTTNLVVVVLFFFIAVAFSFLISRLITNQIVDMRRVFQAVESENFSARATVMGSDELGRLANGLNALLDSTLGLIQSRDERDRIQAGVQKLLMEVSDVAQGDLTVEAEVTADMTGAIADSFNFMIEELRKVIGNVQETSIQVGSSAAEIQATAENLARGSETQAQQVLETSAAIDEMTVSIQQVSENAALSATVADQARANARQGTQAVGKTIEGMNAIRQQVQESAKRIKRLGESSQEIGEIVQLIGDIADRTSILALNASIQAAMAGDAGRGFAVVAGEVERLAERSAEATKRIGTLIKSVQSETNEAVAAMETMTREVVVGSNLANEAEVALAEIEGVSNKLAELIQNISLSSRQQARGSESIAKAMNEISEVIQQTAAGTKQASVSIRNLSDLTDNLRSSVSTFKLPENGKRY
jgi:twitching motility protein PilJ